MENHPHTEMVVLPEIVMHDTYIGGRSQNNIWRASCSQLEYIDSSISILTEQWNLFGSWKNPSYFETLKSDTPLPPINRTPEIDHHWVMGGKKKYIKMFGSFMKPFNLFCFLLTSRQGCLLAECLSALNTIFLANCKKQCFSEAENACIVLWEIYSKMPNLITTG